MSFFFLLTSASLRLVPPPFLLFIELVLPPSHSESEPQPRFVHDGKEDTHPAPPPVAAPQPLLMRRPASQLLPPLYIDMLDFDDLDKSLIRVRH